MPRIDPKRLKVVRIPSNYRWACERFLTNLLAQGFRVINPDGKDITEEMIEEAAATIRVGEGMDAEPDPEFCSRCGGKKNSRRRINGHPCGNGLFHGGRSW
jgi:hypothetical protein